MGQRTWMWILALFFSLLRFFWISEKWWQSSIWYSKVVAFLCPYSTACLISLTHSISPCFSLFLLLSSLTVMPVTCELPGQGTLKRSSTTSSLGLTSIFAIRYVLCVCLPHSTKKNNLIGSFCNQHTAASAEFHIQGSRAHVEINKQDLPPINIYLTVHISAND